MMITAATDAPPMPPFHPIGAGEARQPASSSAASSGPCPARRRRLWGAGAIGLATAFGLLACSPEAWAQAQPASPQAPAAVSETIHPGSVLRLLGRDVAGPDGERVAQVINVLVDAAGQPRAAILDYGGFLGVGKRRIAVAWRALRFTPGQAGGAVTLDLSPEQLKNFPEFKPDGPLVVAAPPAAQD